MVKKRYIAFKVVFYREKKPYYYLINTVGKRVACIVIAALIALTSITFGVKAIREAVIDFFVESFEKFSIVGFKDEDIPENNKTIETYYAPTYIPEGYELKTDEKMHTYRRMRYVLDNNYIEYNQYVLQSISSFIDTERAKTEKVSIIGKDALYLTKDDKCSLCWIDKEHTYLITVQKKIAKQELIKIAESITAEQFVTLCRMRSFNRLKETLYSFEVICYD